MTVIESSRSRNELRRLFDERESSSDTPTRRYLVRHDFEDATSRSDLGSWLNNQKLTNRRSESEIIDESSKLSGLLVQTPGRLNRTIREAAHILLPNFETDPQIEPLDGLLERWPGFAVATLSYLVGSEAVDRRKAVGWLFERSLKARGANRTRLLQGLLRLSTPDDIWLIGKDHYDRYGYGGRLTFAAEILGEMGPIAWPVLKSIAASQSAVADAFVSVIAAVKTVVLEERAKALEALARNPHLEVRWSVCHAADPRDLELFRGALEILAEDADCELKEDAEEKLGSPPPRPAPRLQ